MRKTKLISFLNSYRCMSIFWSFLQTNTETSNYYSLVPWKFVIIFLSDIIASLSKLDNCFLLENSGFSKVLIKSPRNCNLPLETSSPTLSQLANSHRRITSVKKTTHMHITLSLGIFVIYREWINMETGFKNLNNVDEETSFSQSCMSSPLVFESVSNIKVISATEWFKRFSSVDKGVHKNKKTEYSINHVFLSTNVQELKTIHHICWLEERHLLTVLAVSLQNPQIAGYILAESRNNFLYVEASTVCFQDFPQFFPPFCLVD